MYLWRAIEIFPAQSRLHNCQYSKVGWPPPSQQLTRAGSRDRIASWAWHSAYITIRWYSERAQFYSVSKKRQEVSTKMENESQDLLDIILSICNATRLIENVVSLYWLVCAAWKLHKIYKEKTQAGSRAAVVEGKLQKRLESNRKEAWVGWFYEGFLTGTPRTTMERIGLFFVCWSVQLRFSAGPQVG
jgi:hypothetical protein